MSLTVIGLNDAPVNIVPGTQSLDANHTLAIAGLAVTDLDAGAAAITASLTVAHGTLTARQSAASVSRAVAPIR